MKKSNFTAIILGTISGMLFALGMCMALIPQWQAFKQGVVFGVLGIVLFCITIAVWRKMENKKPFKRSHKTVLAVFDSIAGALALGIGMCFSIVWGNMIVGIIIGFIGIIVLLCLIPIVKGIKE